MHRFREFPLHYAPINPILLTDFTIKHYPSMTYQAQLDEKITRIHTQFAPLSPPDITVFTSAEWHFRQRAEFRLWHEGDEAFYAMFEPGQKASHKTLKRTDQLPIASKRINALMPALLDKLSAEPLLIERLYQVEFLSTLNGDTVVTLIYHKKLDEHWQKLAEPLEAALDIHIIGRSRGQKLVLSQDFVTETLSVQGKTYRYRQIEGGFTQPNAEVCEKMLTWACDCAAEINAQADSAAGKGDLLELYCGNGNFTLPLAQHFRKALATEVSKTSVHAAKHNIEMNGCENIAIARISAEEFTEAMTGKREFRRLAQDGIRLADYDVSTIFVDPPRAGVDDDTLKLVQRYDHILYISCNPDTLFDNLQTLTQTHAIQRMAMFDQFPYTHHVEMGVWLRRR